MVSCATSSRASHTAKSGRAWGGWRDRCAVAGPGRAGFPSVSAAHRWIGPPLLKRGRGTRSVSARCGGGRIGRRPSRDVAPGGKPTPWAMVLGAPPAALAAAGMPLPAGVSEDGYVGALAGTGVEVVRTETNGLYVPANAEIVLEGHISADETGPEGPMGEYHGYSFPHSKPQPLFHVEAMTYRDQAVLPVCAAGVPPEENHTIWGTMIAAEATGLLRSAGLPVDLAWCPFEAATCWMVVSIDREKLVASRTTQDQLVREVAEVLFDSHAGWLVPKVILVGDDIDVTDIGQVVWAMATRYRPGTEYTFPEAPGIPMVPYLTAEQIRAGHGGKSVTSCLRPEEFTGTVRATTASFATSYPPKLRRSVIADWAAYGYR
ncbi:UbiD family decarboxylase domain-containing protein [Streptomyces misionensis]|uniref:UbiD family decarboxylase domain-containing protein n=1 Tax=Streptomyces misionensis TaxID=67331 RepID=UPI003BAFBE2D